MKAGTFILHEYASNARWATVPRYNITFCFLTCKDFAGLATQRTECVVLAQSQMCNIASHAAEAREDYLQDHPITCHNPPLTPAIKLR